MNKLKAVLEKRGIKNAFQLKNAIKEADPQKKGIAQGTALAAWNDPMWTPNATTLELICEAFDFQPGDFLFYVNSSTLRSICEAFDIQPDDFSYYVKNNPAKIDAVVKMLEANVGGKE